jgi:hypothetical protein
MNEPTLEVTAIAPDRQKVRIKTTADPDGTIYELVNPEELSVRQLRDTGRKIYEALNLWDESELNKAQEKRLTKLLDEATRTLVIDCPADVAASIPHITKRTLALGFLARSGELAGDVMTPGQLGLYISGRSSPDSNGSTEGTPEPG